MNSALPIDELRLRRFARLAAPMLRGSASQGIGPHATRNRAGVGLEFLDISPYTMGEDARRIDWRQTARREKLVVRRYRDETASDWFLCVDGSASMQDAAKWRFVVELTSALAYLYIYAGHTVSFAIFAERIFSHRPAGRGQMQFAAIVRELNAFSPASRGGASIPGLCTPLIGKSSNAVIISDFLREDTMHDDLRSLRAQVSTASALQVLAEDEMQVYASGPTLLYDVESKTEQQIEMAETTVADVASALDAHKQRLNRRLSSLGIPLVSCTAGDSWERILLAHLGA